MTLLDVATTALSVPGPDDPLAEGHLAAAAFLARYQGRTQDAYRHDLRVFFQWPSRSVSTCWDHPAGDRALRAGPGGPGAWPRPPTTGAYDRGVLSLTIPVAAHAKPSKVKVAIGGPEQTVETKVA